MPLPLLVSLLMLPMARSPLQYCTCSFFAERGTGPAKTRDDCLSSKKSHLDVASDKNSTHVSEAVRNVVPDLASAEVHLFQFHHKTTKPTKSKSPGVRRKKRVEYIE